MKRPSAPLSALACSLLLGAGLFAGCTSAPSKSRAGHPPPDSLGVFVDACHTLIDSFKVEEGGIRVYEPNQEAVHGYFARGVGKRGDTLFYIGGAIAFLRIPDPEGKHIYFFGYNHRGGRGDWEGAMWVQVVPKREMTPGTSYTQGQVFNYFSCSSGELDSSADLSLYEWDGLIIGELIRVPGLESKVGDLMVVVDSLPEFARKGGGPESGERILPLKKLQTMGIKGLWELPVTHRQMRELRLTDAQLLQAGVRLKPKRRSFDFVPVPARHRGEFQDVCGFMKDSTYHLARVDRVGLKFELQLLTEVATARAVAGDTVFLRSHTILLTQADSMGLPRHFIGYGDRERPEYIGFMEYVAKSRVGKGRRFTEGPETATRKRYCNEVKPGTPAGR